MPLYYAQLEAKKPHKNHFRQMVITFTAADGEEAERVINNMIKELVLNAEIIELYKDENATAF